MELQLHVLVAVRESLWSSNPFDTLRYFAKGSVCIDPLNPLYIGN
jgi:hypothetical protein